MSNYITSKLLVATRVYLGFTLVLLLVGAVAVAGVHGVNEAGRAIDQYSDMAEATISLLDLTTDTAEMRIDVLRFTGQADTAALARARDARQGIAKRFDALVAAPAMAGVHDRLVRMRGLFADYCAAVDRLASATGEESTTLSAAMTAKADEFSHLADEVKATQEARLTALDKATVADVAADSTTVAMVSAVAVAVGIALALLIARSIVPPVRAMTGAMGRLAGGDLAVEVPATGRGDELGLMARAVQVFKDNAVAMERMRAEQTEKDRQAEAAKRSAMLSLADDFESHITAVVEHVSSAATEMDATSQSMAAVAEQATRQAAAAAAAAEEASSNVQTVASAAEELASSIREIGRQVAHASATTTAAVEKAHQTDTIVRSLAGAASSIGEVVKLINDIASQTNLLALNATIEAARAGDAGKGFAVVANEVKTLANQTAKATSEIAEQITSVQAATNDAVKAIEDIGTTVAEINQVSAAIASAVEEQQAATGEIARNVEQAAAGTAEVAHNITGVTEAAGEAGRAAGQVMEEAAQLSKTSVELSDEAKGFIARVRAA